VATTGTYNYDPQIVEVIDEAFERGALMDPKDIGQRHLESFFRSLKTMLNSEWSNIGVRRWMIQQAQEPMTVGKGDFRLPIGAIDIVGAVLRRSNADTELYPISRDDYLAIPTKTINGRPDRYWVDRQAGNFSATLSNKRVYLWQRGSNTTDIVVYDYFRQIQDVGAPKNTPQIPTNAMAALMAGMSAYMAEKFKPERFDKMMLRYKGPNWADPTRTIGGELGALLMEDRERSDIEISVDFTRRGRPGR
jgi:hypothetical protein